MSLLKRLSFLLAIVLIVTLASCQKTTTTTTTTTTAGTTTTASTTGTTASTTGTTASTTGTTTTTAGTTTTSTTASTASQPTVITIGTWWQAGADPTYVDPATGTDPNMSDQQRTAELAALQTVQQQLGVTLQWVQYPDDLRQDILQSVLADDPFADIVDMWGGSQGTVLAQNVLQDLTPYQSAFGSDASWMLGSMNYGGKIYGWNEAPITGFPFWPLVYNITDLQNCDTLAADPQFSDGNGGVLIPSQLWAENKWTWPTFEAYLKDVKACTIGENKTNGGATVYPYETDYRYLTLSLMAADGVGEVQPDGSLGLDTPQAIETLQFVQQLANDGIIGTTAEGGGTATYEGYTPTWTNQTQDFDNGLSVFNDATPWWLGDSVSKLTAAGQELGIVPYPVGPSTLSNPTEYPYHAPFFGQNVMGIPKGVDAATAQLAIKAYALFMEQTWINEGYTGSADYINQQAQQTAAQYFPVTNPTYGASLQTSYDDWLAGFKTLDSGVLLGIDPNWTTLVAQMVADTTKDPQTTITANMNEFTDPVDKLNAALSGTSVVDNQPPVVTQIANTSLVFPVGTDMSKVDWTQYFTAKDIGSDTTYDIAAALAGTNLTAQGNPATVPSAVDYSKIDNTQPNTSSKVIFNVEDSSGNFASYSFNVIFYDPSDTTPPTIALASGVTTPIQLTVDQDLSTVNWTQYVKATDTEGTVTFDLTSLVKADYTSVDTSTPGDYTVTLSVTDYAGNTTTYDLPVTVVDNSN